MRKSYGCQTEKYAFDNKKRQNGKREKSRQRISLLSFSVTTTSALFKTISLEKPLMFL